MKCYGDSTDVDCVLMEIRSAVDRLGGMVPADWNRRMNDMNEREAGCVIGPPRPYDGGHIHTLYASPELIALACELTELADRKHGIMPLWQPARQSTSGSPGKKR